MTREIPFGRIVKMTKAQAVALFQKEYEDLYRNRADYWTAQQAWAMFVDHLNRSGDITDKQRDNWTTPFRYGKPLRLYERKIYST